MRNKGCDVSNQERRIQDKEQECGVRVNYTFNAPINLTAPCIIFQADFFHYEGDWAVKFSGALVVLSA